MSSEQTSASYEFTQDRILIGRGRGADVRLPHRAVSIRHATIEFDGLRYSLIDHDSTNGTSVQGARLVPGRAKTLRNNDEIEVGGFMLTFESGVAVRMTTDMERTSSLARRLARALTSHEAFVPPPTLTLLNGPSEGEVFEIPPPPARLVIGRGEDCDLRLDDADVSREHMELDIRLDEVHLTDLDSKNGVLLNGRLVAETMLGDRDEIRVGDTILCFEDPAADLVDELETGDDEEEAYRALDVSSMGLVETTTLPVPEVNPAPSPEAPKDITGLSRTKRSMSSIDAMIYLLASLVLASSLVGLFWLFHAS